MQATRYKKPDAIRELEDAVFDAKRQKYPKVPYLIKHQYSDKTANDLTRAIIDFVRLRGGQAERINTTGRPIDRRVAYTDVVGMTRTVGSIEWIKGTGTRGSADISATIKGQSVKIEVKIGTDRQSQAQKEYEKNIEAAGGIYYIARDFTSFVEWYHSKFGKGENNGK